MTVLWGLIHVWGDADGKVSLDLTTGHPSMVGLWPGDSRAFQLWFRDAAQGVGAFNLSDGMSLTFGP